MLMWLWLWDTGPYFLLSFAASAAHSSSPLDPHRPWLSFSVAGVPLCSLPHSWTLDSGLI